MKKTLFAVFAALFLSAGLFAYNPPAGGQNFLRITGPQLLSGGYSSAGSGLFSAAPSSIAVNPALTAWEQRIVLDLGGTFLLNSGDDSGAHPAGGAMELGLLVPSKWCVSTVLFQGVWAPFDKMDLENSFNLTGSVSKDITEKVSVGANLNIGLLYGSSTDWAANLALGVFYNYGDLFFMKNLRFGAALSNLGKVYTNSGSYGISIYDHSSKYKRSYYPSENGGFWWKDDYYDNDADFWPGYATLRTGVAATLVDVKNFNLGLSLDLSYPAFQNFVFDTGLQLMFVNMIKVGVSWEYDVQEAIKGADIQTPAIGVSFKFMFNSKDGSYMAKKGWQQSEMTTSVAWQNIYSGINAISAGAVINLGLKDTQPPEIILWGGEN